MNVILCFYFDEAFSDDVYSKAKLVLRRFPTNFTKISIFGLRSSIRSLRLLVTTVLDKDYNDKYYHCETIIPSYISHLENEAFIVKHKGNLTQIAPKSDLFHPVSLKELCVNSVLSKYV